MGIQDREYMRDSTQTAGPPALWVAGAIVVSLALIGGWYALVRGIPERHHGALEKPKLLRTDTVELGEFEVVSGAIAISDPCYQLQPLEADHLGKKVSNVATGMWRARVIHHVVNTPDRIHCGELVAFLAASPLPKDPNWLKLDHSIAVDSSQAGFFDRRHFGSDAVVPPRHPWKGKMIDPKQPWYSLCCDANSNEHQAGVIPYGVVSVSGWGDGSYPVYTISDEKGTVIGLRLVFIAREEYDIVEQK